MPYSFFTPPVSNHPRFPWGKVFILTTAVLFVLGLAIWWRKDQRAEEKSSVNLSDWVTSNTIWQPDPDEEVPPLQDVMKYPPLPPPPPPSLGDMKYEGCVADGFLSGYGDDIDASINLVNHSECRYLHRALETWLKPPDFVLARKIFSKVKRQNIIYGMFISEAISTNSEYFFPEEDRNFNFRKMCRPDTTNDWGEHTCKPSFQRSEYRKYLRFITERAMDMGIQSFLFGEVFYQENKDLSKAVIPDIIREMRDYAEFRGMQIVVGAQTNDITDEKYLRNFDFIEGGVGIDDDGTIQDGPCHTRWWKQPGDWCWALLWHPDYREKANHVFVHLDWSGRIGDDMSVFTRMTKEERAATLDRLYHDFKRMHIGFLFPLMATLHRDNGGCYGPKKRYYSADRKYTCQDEDTVNTLLRGD